MSESTAQRVVASATQVGNLPIRSFILDGYSKLRLSDLTTIGTLMDRALAANANTFCITYNLAFDPTGQVLDTAVMNQIEETALHPDDLVPVIRLARSKGLAVMIKPETTIYDATAGPRDSGNIGGGVLSPYSQFDLNVFFAGYQSRLDAFAEMAQREGVSIFSVGTEADAIDGAQYDGKWRGIIASIRSRFSGSLTYGAAIRFNQTTATALDFREVTFWDALDMIGLSIYPGWATRPGRFSDYEPMELFSHVQSTSTAPVVDLKALIEPVLQKYGKKLFIEEFALQATPDQLQTGYDVSYTRTALQDLPSPDYSNQAVGTSYFMQYFMTAFDGELVGFNPWVFLSAPWVVSGTEAPRWRLSQFLVIGETDGALVSKPALNVIGDYYGGTNLDQTVVHRPIEGGTAYGGPFRDVVYRPTSRSPNSSSSTTIVGRGGAGINTAVYTGPASAFNFAKQTGEVHVWSTLGTSAFPDVLQSFQRLVFSDTAVALDSDGNAGMAYRLYRAAFSRQPDLPGLGYWIASLDKGSRLEDVAQSFANSAEFQTRYGALSNRDYVVQLYQNVLGRAPDDAGLAYWTGHLDSGLESRGQVLAGFSESSENQQYTAPATSSGISYVPY